jgi:hypothetical protein
VISERLDRVRNELSPETKKKFIYILARPFS